jgi:hypothetical protein
VKVLPIVFISFYVLAFWSLQQAYAQTVATYRNPNLGFIIDYPTDWKVGESAILDEKVSFTPPDKDLPVFYVHVRQVSSYLDTDTMTVKNKTVEQIVHEEMINMSKPNPFGFESKVIKQNQFTVDGNAGWKMEMFMGPEGNPFMYVYQVLTVANGKIYFLEYNEEPLKVPQTLTLVNKMVESFHIIR